MSLAANVLCVYVFPNCISFIANFIADSQSTFTLTSSPVAIGNQLCPGRVTFTCRTVNVTGLGTAIRWFFNQNSTKLFEFVYFMGQDYPFYVVNGTFVVVVANASLLPAMVNAVVTLTVDSAVLIEMGVYRLSCGRELDNNIKSFNISGIEMQRKWLNSCCGGCFVVMFVFLFGI